MFAETYPQFVQKSRWLKNLVHSAALSDAAGFLVRPLLVRSWHGTINVVYYHYVGTAQPHYSAFYRGCTVEKFSNDLRILSQIFDFVPLAEALRGSPRTQHGRPKLALTFDDGFDLRKGGAMEVLERFGVKATTFVMTAAVGNHMLMWRCVLSAIEALVPEPVWRREYLELAACNGLPPLPENQTLLQATCNQWSMERKDELAAELWKRCSLPPIENYLAENKPYFDWDGLKEWLGAGHSVGFHTHTHPFCSRLRSADLECELIRPAVQLKQRLGLEDMCLSYPFGDPLPPVLERALFEKGLFKAIFGTNGFSPRGTLNARLGRLSMEDCNVEKQLLSERLLALRRRMLR